MQSYIIQPSIMKLWEVVKYTPMEISGEKKSLPVLHCCNLKNYVSMDTKSGDHSENLSDTQNVTMMTSCIELKVQASKITII